MEVKRRSLFNFLLIIGYFTSSLLEKNLSFQTHLKLTNFSIMFLQAADLKEKGRETDLLMLGDPKEEDSFMAGEQDSMMMTTITIIDVDQASLKSWV